jgi:phytol kinase
VSGVLPFEHAWMGIGAALGAFVILFLAIALYARMGGSPELTRKLLHAGSGLLTLTFPFVFRSAWPVFLLAGASATLIAAAKFLPALRPRLGRVASGVARTTLGEIYFPAAVAWLF